MFRTKFEFLENVCAYFSSCILFGIDIIVSIFTSSFDATLWIYFWHFTSPTTVFSFVFLRVV